MKFKLTFAVVLLIALVACTGERKTMPLGDADTELEYTEQEQPVVSKCGEGMRSHNPGTLTYKNGGSARICEAGSALDGAQVLADRRDVDGEFDVEISLADDDIVPQGWKPLGPPVLFSAPVGAEIANSLEFRIPFDLQALTDDVKDYSINVVNKPLDGDTVRFLPKSPALIRINRDLGFVEFEWDSLGTFQVITFAEPHQTKVQHFTYRAIAGVSMGAGGAGFIGFKHPEEFDIIGMLGGPVDLTYLIHMIRDYLMGGFCTPDEFIDDNGVVDEQALTDPLHPCGACMNVVSPLAPDQEEYKCYLVPPSDPDGIEHPNGFNHWYYDDNGGNFDRDSYIKLFRDLSLAFGNPIGYHPQTPYLPAGLPVEIVELARTQPDIFCNPQAIADWMHQHGYAYPLENYYDDEYNPDGSLPVIVFCDGMDASHEPYCGDFDPAHTTNNPMDVALAVDINGNGIRDYGEPVIRNTWEPYQDCGLDRLCNEDEPGYDPETNPDPNGDDYNPYTNPSGTEKNWLCDGCTKPECTPGDNPNLAGICETWFDFGIDGVSGTPQVDDGGYDYGEGNGRFDLNPNVAEYYFEDPHQRILAMEQSNLERLHVWVDGGVRDLFNFGVQAANLYGLLRMRLGDDAVRFYDGIERLLVPPAPRDLSGFDILKVDYGKLGRNVFLRYGHIDATPEEILNGDGRHVGSPKEIVYRIQTFLLYAAQIFPYGDYTPVPDYTVNDILIADYFYSEHMGRNRRYSIVLPPGYNQPEFENTTYPVVYFMHGYGQEPRDIATGLAIMLPLMAEGKIAKFIAVFPDGKCESPESCYETCETITCAGKSGSELEECRQQCEQDCADVHRECVQGSFYVNHRATYDHITRWQDDEQRYGQIEDYFFYLVNYIEANYRVRQPEDVEVDSITGEWVY